MKDDRLEKEFGEYFQSVNIPDDITADAKKCVKQKSAFMPRFIKFASITASFVLVLTVALVITLNTRQNLPAVDSPATSVSIYGEADLSYEQADIYGITEIDKSLKFIRNLAYNGASVKDCSAGYMDGELAIVKTDISLIDGLSRYDAQVFVEFTDKNTVYSPLKAYTEGDKGSYRGIEYSLIRETAENGEPINKLYFTYGGNKYYFNVTSSDENSYIKCINLVLR